MEQLLAAAEKSSKIIVFSGSGLSATSGMSTFSTRGGLYEKAQKKFKLSDGKMLFTYTFFDRRRLEAQAFFADIYTEATRAHPAPGHHALAELLGAGRLHRHYTLNIDGLAGMVGMDTWHPDTNPNGVTVEMHGNVRLLVCVECGGTVLLNGDVAKQLRAQQRVACAACGHEAMRFKVMMYEDAESEAITPEEVMDLMEEDVKQCDLILWVGISFQQSASTAYFRNVRRWLQEAGRAEDVLQAVVNPSDEAVWNLMTASSNQSDLNVLEVLAESDDVLPQLADHLSRLGGSLGQPSAARRGQPQLQQQAAPVIKRGRSSPLQEQQQAAAQDSAVPSGSGSGQAVQPPQQPQQHQLVPGGVNGHAVAGAASAALLGGVQPASMAPAGAAALLAAGAMPLGLPPALAAALLAAGAMLPSGLASPTALALLAAGGMLPAAFPMPAPGSYSQPAAGPGQPQRASSGTPPASAAQQPAACAQQRACVAAPAAAVGGEAPSADVAATSLPAGPSTQGLSAAVAQE